MRAHTLINYTQLVVCMFHWFTLHVCVCKFGLLHHTRRLTAGMSGLVWRCPIKVNQKLLIESIFSLLRLVQ